MRAQVIVAFAFVVTLAALATQVTARAPGCSGPGSLLEITPQLLKNVKPMISGEQRESMLRYFVQNYPLDAPLLERLWFVLRSFTAFSDAFFKDKILILYVLFYVFLRLTLCLLQIVCSNSAKSTSTAVPDLLLDLAFFLVYFQTSSF